MRKRKLAIISWYGPIEPDAGERVRLQGLTSEFDSDFDISWVVLDRTEAQRSPTGAFVPPKSVSVKYRVPKSEYIRATLRGRAIEAQHPARSPGIQGWVGETLSKLQPEVVLANQPFAWATVPVAMRRLTVTDTHNVNSARLARIASTMRRSSPLRRVLLRQVSLTRNLEYCYVQAGPATWVVSEEDRHQLPSSRRVSIVPNGTHIQPLAVATRPDKATGLRLLFLGSLGYSANVDALQRLAELVRKSTGGFRIDVAGSGPTSTARAICATDDRLVFIGHITDVPDAMSNHHGLIAPHRQGGGSRIKILEAMGAQLPIIATSIAVEGTGLEKQTEYINIDEHPSLEPAISKLLDTREIQDMTARARSRVVKFSWQTISQNACSRLVGLADDIHP